MDILAKRHFTLSVALCRIELAWGELSPSAPANMPKLLRDRLLGDPSANPSASSSANSSVARGIPAAVGRVIIFSFHISLFVLPWVMN
jgi:hypothetical protein